MAQFKDRRPNMPYSVDNVFDPTQPSKMMRVNVDANGNSTMEEIITPPPTRVDFMRSAKIIRDQIEIIQIILNAPAWPLYSDLPPDGKELFDYLDKWMKTYTKLVIKGHYRTAIKVLGNSTKLMNKFVDDVSLIDQDCRIQLLMVWKYYADLLAKWLVVQKGNK